MKKILKLKNMKKIMFHLHTFTLLIYLFTYTDCSHIPKVLLNI